MPSIINHTFNIRLTKVVNLPTTKIVDAETHLYKVVGADDGEGEMRVHVLVRLGDGLVRDRELVDLHIVVQQLGHHLRLEGRQLLKHSRIRLHKWSLRSNQRHIQVDQSGCAKPPVNIKTKVQF